MNLLLIFDINKINKFGRHGNLVVFYEENCILFYLD